MSKQVLLYGIGGARKAYTVINYSCIFEDCIDIKTIMMEARRLAMNPEVEKVYAVDNRRGLRREYLDSL